jgi:hypothetical protein
MLNCIFQLYYIGIAAPNSTNYPLHHANHNLRAVHISDQLRWSARLIQDHQWKPLLHAACPTEGDRGRLEWEANRAR